MLRDVTETPALDYATPPQPLTGGFWAELFAFSLVDAPTGWTGELVARVMPEPLLAAKETVVQSAVADAGVPTPTVRASGGPDAGLGRAFMVMDRAGGDPLLGGLDGAGAILGAPRRLWRMPDVLARVMATLHSVDPAPVREQLDRLDGTATTVPEMLDGLRGWSDGLGRGDLAGAAGWLIDHPRPPSPPVICHGDLHPFNVLVDPAGRVTLLDWSAALIASRAYDVAFTTLVLSTPPIAVPGAARLAVAAAGRGLASRFARRYQHHSDVAIDPADLIWHQAVVALRALVEVAQWAHEGALDARAGHPWLISGDTFAARLTSVTGIPARPR